MQEVHRALSELYFARKELQNAARFVLTHPGKSHALSCAVSRLQDAAQRRLMVATNNSISTATRSFVDIRVQADVQTYHNVEKATFDGLAERDRLKKKAAKQAVLGSNNDALAACMAYKLTKLVFQGHMKKGAQRHVAITAALAKSEERVHAFYQCSRVFQSAVECSRKSQQAVGTSICVTNNKMPHATFSVVTGFWERFLLQATRIHATAMCIRTSKDYFQMHRQIQDVYSHLFLASKDMLVRSALEAQKAKTACIQAQTKRHKTYDKLKSAFNQFASVSQGRNESHEPRSVEPSTPGDTAQQCRQRAATSAFQQGTKQAGTRPRAKTTTVPAIPTESELMKQLTSAIQKRMAVPESPTAEAPFQAAAARATAPAANLTASRPAFPRTTAILSTGSAASTVLTSSTTHTAQRAAASRRASEHQQAHNRMEQALDQEAVGLSRRLQDLEGALRARAQSSAATRQSEMNTSPSRKSPE